MADRNAFSGVFRYLWLGVYYGCLLWVPIGLARAFGKALWFVDDRYFSWLRESVHREAHDGPGTPTEDPL